MKGQIWTDLESNMESKYETSGLSKKCPYLVRGHQKSLSETKKFLQVQNARYFEKTRGCYFFENRMTVTQWPIDNGLQGK